ncbi:DUF2914 domain-containing protein [Thiomicrorhabdus sp. zzn3]|uniref:DUF2914 domain-containing protein n=1 Tax=Thiomicrorhabdus sp. zzn3 TaxID=3039775 RepID=UPI0024363A65|nr:DUF2914 domain-containing protein [Thiomicrorhabdus sp. zzn3]MDG6777085.1 DUF2914 domain-containing protein [Thiomicrorhabdus sp. zzn3]
MQLPDTHNASHLHAFKKGYRLALEGKTINSAPSKIRYDRELRDFCQQGWEQAQTKMAETLEATQSKPWRSRIAWVVMMAIGGISTGLVLIDKADQEKEPFTNRQETASSTVSQKFEIQPPEKGSTPNRSDHPNANTVSHTPPAQADDQAVPAEKHIEATPAKSEKMSASSNETTDKFALLTAQQREDLQQLKQQQVEKTPPVSLSTPVVASDIAIIESAISAAIVDKSPQASFEQTVPKNVRKLYFFTQIEGADKQTIYHRWIYDNRQMALIPLTIRSNLYRTWSSKRLTSAWQGRWTLEVLDGQKQVIYRTQFSYGNGK